MIRHTPAKCFLPLTVAFTVALLTATAKAALINGGPGNDTLLGTILGDSINGFAGNDFLRGDDGNDALFGGDDNDVLLGDQGNDFVSGQGGSDLLIWNNGDGSDLMEGGADTDTVQVNGANGAGDDISIDPNGARVRVQRNNLGLFSLDIGTTENLDINGQGGNDIIIGSVGLAALGINLDLDGGEGNDLLIGGDGADVLRGGAGNDTLLGNKGNDIVLGEDGNDLLIWNNGDGSDFMEGGADTDTVQVNGANGAGDDISISANGNRVRVQRNNLGLFSLDIGTTENLDINGQGGNDIISAAGLAVGLIALDLDGGEGSDLLIGSDGVDTLRGGAGNDTLIGGRGNDIVLGEEGNDLIVFDSPDVGVDLVFGFDANDVLDVTGVFIGQGLSLNPGDDLFSLGLLDQVMVGLDSLLYFRNLGGVYQQFAQLTGVSELLTSTAADPYLIVIGDRGNNGVPVPGTLLLLLIGGYALRRRRLHNCLEPQNAASSTVR